MVFFVEIVFLFILMIFNIEYRVWELLNIGLLILIIF